MAISTVNVTDTATVLAAGDGLRRTLVVQHIDETDTADAIWVAPSAAVAVGSGLRMAGLGATLNVTQGSGASNAWYGIAASGKTITCVVLTGV